MNNVRCPICDYVYDRDSSGEVLQHQRYHDVWLHLSKSCNFPKSMSKAIALVEDGYDRLRDPEYTSELPREALLAEVKLWCLRKHGLHALSRLMEGGANYLPKERYCWDLLEVNNKTFGERVCSLGREWLKGELCA